jgi:hypothetical protein
MNSFVKHWFLTSGACLEHLWSRLEALGVFREYFRRLLEAEAALPGELHRACVSWNCVRTVRT